MKFEVEVRRVITRVSESTVQTTWGVTLDHEDSDTYKFVGVGSTPGEAFEQALMKTCFQLIDGDE